MFSCVSGCYNMAVPPSYADLGKAARDLLTKGFSEFTRFIIIECLVGQLPLLPLISRIYPT